MPCSVRSAEASGISRLWLQARQCLFSRKIPETRSTWSPIFCFALRDIWMFELHETGRPGSQPRRRRVLGSLNLQCLPWHAACFGSYGAAQNSQKPTVERLLCLGGLERPNLVPLRALLLPVRFAIRAPDHLRVHAAATRVAGERRAQRLKLWASI